MRFVILLDLIWKRRNTFIFVNLLWSDHEVKSRLLNLKHHLQLGDELYKAGGYNHHHTEASMLRWRPPNLGFVCLNVGGAWTVHGPTAACGG